MTTREQMYALTAELQSWRTRENTDELAAEFDGKIPFCEKCADWHSPESDPRGAECSMTDKDNN